jgi:hypothetical protein
MLNTPSLDELAMSHFALAVLMTLFTNTLWAEMHHPYYNSPLTNGIRVGSEINGTILYLCRGSLFNSIQPGKTWAGYNRCNVAYEGKEYVLDQFTIPNQCELGHLTWDEDERGAIKVGTDSNGNPLFLCQSNFRGSILPGKTWPGYHHCIITFAGREIITDHYRTLINRDGIIVHSPRSLHSYSNNPKL